MIFPLYDQGYTKVFLTLKPFSLVTFKYEKLLKTEHWLGSQQHWMMRKCLVSFNYISKDDFTVIS